MSAQVRLLEESVEHRHRLSAHRATAQAFTDTKIMEMRVFPAEREYIVAQYLQAALDDEALGPGVDGNLRVQLLANSIAARTSVSHLTAEALAPTAMQALHAKISAPTGDDLSEEEKNRLLGMSPLGKALGRGKG